MDGYKHVNIPYTITTRSVVTQTILKPEIRRPNVVKYWELMMNMKNDEGQWRSGRSVTSFSLKYSVVHRVANSSGQFQTSGHIQ